MIISDFYKIVGEHYNYSKEVSNGSANVKTLEKRNLDPLFFPTDMQVNKENMILCESLNKGRR